jgi:hypothetical protein
VADLNDEHDADDDNDLLHLQTSVEVETNTSPKLKVNEKPLLEDESGDGEESVSETPPPQKRSLSLSSSFVDPHRWGRSFQESVGSVRSNHFPLPSLTLLSTLPSANQAKKGSVCLLPQSPKVTNFQEGYLTYKSLSAIIFTEKWHRVYVVLNQSELYFYSSREDYRLKPKQTLKNRPIDLTG